MEMKADVTDILEGARRLNAAPRLIHDELHQATVRATTGLYQEITNEVPVKTGKLRASHEMKVTGAGASLKGTVSTSMYYAKWVHDGRGPVVAKKAGTLTFVIGGRRIFTKRVGPSRPDPWFRRGVRQARARIIIEFAQVLPRVGKRLGF